MGHREHLSSLQLILLGVLDLGWPFWVVPNWVEGAGALCPCIPVSLEVGHPQQRLWPQAGRFPELRAVAASVAEAGGWARGRRKGNLVEHLCVHPPVARVGYETWKVHVYCPPSFGSPFTTWSTAIPSHYHGVPHFRVTGRLHNFIGVIQIFIRRLVSVIRHFNFFGFQFPYLQNRYNVCLTCNSLFHAYNHSQDCCVKQVRSYRWHFLWEL